MNKFISFKRFAVATALLLLFVHARSQDSSADPCVDISKVEYVTYMINRASSTFINRNESLSEIFSSLNFKKGMAYSGNVPGNHVTKKAVLRFRICNNSDSTASVWFFPGFFYWDVKLYRQHGDQLQALPTETPRIKDDLGYRKLSLPAHDSAVIYAELRFIKTYINSMRPRLIQPKRLTAVMADMRSPHIESHMITYVFCGLLLMMILFSGANYLQGANREYLYYSGYALFVGGMLFTKALYDFYSNTTSYFFESYLDFIMQCIGHGCYMFFMKEFLVTRTHHRFLNKLYNYGVIMLLASMIIYTFFHYFTNNYVVEYWTENATKILLLLMTLAFLIYSLRRWKDRLLRFVFWGNLCLFVFSLLSQVSVMIEDRLLPGVWGSALFYYEMGLFLELVFFLAGLNYKNRQLIIEQTEERERLRTENQMKEYEKEIAVYKAQQEERQRISADMHDELGAGMTAIRLMSEIARNKMKESTPIEIERISHSADEVLNKMNAIIWSMNSGNDTLDNLVSYIRSYALEYFDGTPVECKVVTPRNIPPTELTGDKRRNVFLCVKETLNNALKHSGASEIKIEFEINHSLVIRISDNGVGIDMQRIRQFGNGLKNISRRMESIGGTYRIENNKGTVTVLMLPLS